MSFRIDGEVCIGCGVCEYACPTDAIVIADHQRRGVTPYVIQPETCNDCQACVALCPADCIAQDPESIVCHGRGCPLNPRSAWARWQCSELVVNCPTCANVVWREPGSDRWLCLACDMGRRGACPKVKAARARSAEAAHQN